MNWSQALSVLTLHAILTLSWGAVASARVWEIEFEQNEFWLKYSRAVSVGGPATGFDYPPHVVRVRSKYGTAHRENVEGELILRDSPWDPLTTLLPKREMLESYLWWPIFLDREMTLAGALDPDAFLPFADTISGSRWPGENGGPKRS